MVAEGRALEEEVAKLREAAKNPLLTEDARLKKRNEAEEKLTELQEFQLRVRRTQETKLKQMREQVMKSRQGIVDELMAAVADFAKAEGYDLVLDRSGMTMNAVPLVVVFQSRAGRDGQADRAVEGHGHRRGRRNRRRTGDVHADDGRTGGEAGRRAGGGCRRRRCTAWRICARRGRGRCRSRSIRAICPTVAASEAAAVIVPKDAADRLAASPPCCAWRTPMRRSRRPARCSRPPPVAMPRGVHPQALRFAAGEAGRGRVRRRVRGGGGRGRDRRRHDALSADLRGPRGEAGHRTACSIRSPACASGACWATGSSCTTGR